MKTVEGGGGFQYEDRASSASGLLPSLLLMWVALVGWLGLAAHTHTTVHTHIAWFALLGRENEMLEWRRRRRRRLGKWASHSLCTLQVQQCCCLWGDFTFWLARKKLIRYQGVGVLKTWLFLTYDVHSVPVWCDSFLVEPPCEDRGRSGSHCHADKVVLSPRAKALALVQDGHVVRLVWNTILENWLRTKSMFLNKNTRITITVV